MRLITRRVVAGAQLLLSVLYLGGYFWVLSEFIHGKINVPVEWKDTIGALLSVLTAGNLQILQFWFSRSRPEDPVPHCDAGLTNGN
jgi:hypothetical protein